MSSVTNNFDWRVGYGVFCLIFAAWVIYLGLDNFDKVHGEYREAAGRMQPGQIEKIALQELTDQCRAKLKRRQKSQRKGTYQRSANDNCLSFSETTFTEKREAVTENLQKEKKRFLRKLIVFYITFGAFFLVLPLYLLYLLLSFLVWVFKDIKIHK